MNFIQRTRKTIAVLCLYFLSRTVADSIMPDQRRLEKNMLGAYNSASSTNDDPALINAATFAIRKFIEKNMMKPNHFTQPLSNSIPQDFRFGISKVSKQVVAGQNYNLDLVLFWDDSCRGGFNVVVYDHFQTLTISIWGKEIICDSIMDNTITLHAM